jgi:hypothetical protein
METKGGVLELGTKTGQEKRETETPCFDQTNQESKGRRGRRRRPIPHAASGREPKFEPSLHGALFLFLPNATHGNEGLENLLLDPKDVPLLLLLVLLA